ncbi:MAG: SUMF1/EgtB/PvdO family nonheme iron enzyme [Rhodovibrio sp.]|nr:SUMF1/EgtB/PvdO family nonheme iron enzyme [Rhodovibrio sp.]
MQPIEGARINEMNYRQAMALPAHFEASRFQGNSRAYATYFGIEVSRLAEMVEDVRTPLEERYAIGNILALRGDPRVATESPAMIALAGGTAMIGTDPAEISALAARYRDVGVLEAWLEKETPRHACTVAPFRMAKYPVTNQEYLAFLEDTHSAFLPTSWRFGRFPEHRANHPVYSVSPEAADAYAIWLSKRTGRSFRLPREVEWEFAAGGAQGFEFPWGDTFRAAACNTLELGVRATTPVGIFPEGNARSGFADMAGNVEELVGDVYRPYPGGQAVEDDIARANPDYRMTRGGGFTRFADLARCRRRHGYIASPLYAIGFRLCED